jgi:hypothetical protein
MHMNTLRRACNRGRITDDWLEAQRHEQFCEWYRAYVKKMWCSIYIYVSCVQASLKYQLIKLINFAFFIVRNTHIG